MRFALAAVAAVALSSSAFAAVTATATTDLNLRSGPTTNSEVLGTISSGGQVILNGCVEGRSWCEVEYEGQTGFASANYLTADLNGSRVVVQDNLGPLGIAINAVGNAVTGTAETVGNTAGALIRGTAETVANVIDPPEERIVYVRENRVEPVYFDDAVAVGVGLPETVQIREVPNYDYGYAYVNGQPVFVDRDTRRVVYVVR